MVVNMALVGERGVMAASWKVENTRTESINMFGRTRQTCPRN